MKNKFKIGDTVYHDLCGKCVIIKEDEMSYMCRTLDGKHVFSDSKYLFEKTEDYV